MMQKISIVILFILLSSVVVKAQQVIYSQNFETPKGLLKDFVLANLDKGDPTGTELDTLKKVAWYVNTAGAAGNHAAIATSNYDPAAAADDWFITPAIRLGKASKLSWKCLSLTNGKTDTYEVYVSTTEQSVSGCLFNGSVAKFTSSNSAAFDAKKIDLALAGYANQKVFIGFRLTTKTGGDKLAIDDLMVTEDSTRFVSLKFVVNMSYYIKDTLFNPRKDTVDIAGSFNNFEGTKHILSIVPGSDSAIYSITIPGFVDGDRLEFKFRINSTWHDSIVEFPYGQPNRIWIIEPGKYTFTCYYNDKGKTVDVPENELMAKVRVYPNPVESNASVEFPESFTRCMLVSLTGTKIKDMDLKSKNAINLDVSSLSRGTYILLFYSNKGFVGSRKLVKK